VNAEIVSMRVCFSGLPRATCMPRAIIEAKRGKRDFGVQDTNRRVAL
jgi:hypothetical protein